MMNFKILLATLPSLALAFTPSPLSSPITATQLHLFKNNNNNNKAVEPTQQPGSMNSRFEGVFKGGLFEEDIDDDTIMAGAIQIASKIKSTKDLGWTQQPPRRKGNARPRSRAWGGENEMPVQSKANYDETKENCVEKWLTIEDLIKFTKTKPGPMVDTVFVALAGGAKYAERDVCETKIEQWGTARGNKINEDAFKKSVKAGRFELLSGYFSFLFVNAFFASCIIFPTNPAAKGLESLVDGLKEILGPLAAAPPPPM